MKTFCFIELDEVAKKNALLGIRRTLSYKVKMMWLIQQEIEQYFSAMNPCINFYVEKHMNVFSQKVELLLSHEMEEHDIFPRIFTEISRTLNSIFDGENLQALRKSQRRLRKSQIAILTR